MSKNKTNPFADLATRISNESATLSKEAPKIDHGALAAQAQRNAARRKADREAEAARRKAMADKISAQRDEFIALVKDFGEKNQGVPRKRWTPEQWIEAGEYAIFLLSKRQDKKPSMPEPQVSVKVRNQLQSLFATWINGYTEAELPQWRFEGGFHRWAVRKRSPQVGLSLGFLGEYMTHGWKPESHGLRVPMHPRNVTRQAQQPKRQKQPA